MTVGMATGLDIVELARFEALLARESGFVERYFTDRERACCGAARASARAFATAFAVKEALLKALGAGVLGAIALDEIEVAQRGARTSVGVRGAAAQAVGARTIWASSACDGQQVWAVVVLS